MSHDTIHSTTAAEPVGPYPHARRVGNLLFLSGVGPRQRGSKVVPGSKVDAAGTLVDYDIEAEIRSCFANVRAVLTDCGAKWEDIVDITVLMTNMQRDWADYSRVYAEFFPSGDNQPTRTTLEIKGLPQGGNTPIHFEVKVVAVIAQ